MPLTNYSVLGRIISGDILTISNAEVVRRQLINIPNVTTRQALHDWSLNNETMRRYMYWS